VLDIGCGDGRILEALSVAIPGITVSGIDSSSEAIRIARERGLAVEQVDIRNLEVLRHERVDWALLLEVLEHMPESEMVLAWAREHARKGVIISIPNTGFIVHRLRLLFGRFPLQWRAYPGEHVRFWTLRDVQWWLSSLGLSATILCYEGVPVLSSIFPSLFAEGIIICINPD
jgi:methionine biosynthesis protein MetW